ncbi:hypothetical protein ACFE04_028744 [Oxalis oulophora]
MGIMPHHQTCHSNSESQSQYSNNHFQLDSPTLSSQPSFPFISNIQYECLNTLKFHSSYICSLVVSGKYMYTGSSSNQIRLWNCDSLESQFNNEILFDNNVVAEGKGAVKAIVVLSDKLFTAHQDHKIRVWKINHDEDKFTRLATLPTLKDRAIKLLQPKNHVRIRRHKKCTWVNHVDTVSALALSHDKTLLFSVSWDRSIKIWRMNDFKCLQSVANAHDDAINSLALSDEGCLYTGSADKKIKVWKKVEGENKYSLFNVLENHNSGVNALALSVDGSVLFSGGCDQTILAWEKADGGKMVISGELEGHTKSILCLIVVSDLVLSGSADKSIRIWTSVEKKYFCLAVLEGHNGPVKCLTGANECCESSNKSQVVYSTSLDGDIKVWQIYVPVM